MPCAASMRFATSFDMDLQPRGDVGGRSACRHGSGGFSLAGWKVMERTLLRSFLELTSIDRMELGITFLAFSSMPSATARFE